jgi:hypothetical protein
MSPRSLRPVLLAAVLCCLTAWPVLGLDLGGHDRDGTVIGLDIGSGWTRVQYATPDGTGQTDNQAAFSGGIRVGWAKNDNLITSVGLYGWKKSFNQNLTPFSVRTFNFLIEAFWFPRGEGFWLKGGAGGGSLDFSAVFPEARTTLKKGGWNFSAGAGYEFRIADETAVGLSYDFRFTTVGEFQGFEDTKVYTNSLFLTLHFYM